LYREPAEGAKGKIRVIARRPSNLKGLEVISEDKSKYQSRKKKLLNNYIKDLIAAMPIYIFPFVIKKGVL